MSGRRRAGVWALVVLASVIGLITILTVWVNRQMLDNNQWKKASAQLIQDPQVRSALSVYLVNELYNNVDVAGQLEKQLPKQVKPLAAPAAAALRQPAVYAVNFLLSQGRVQQSWINASALAHQKLINVLENKTGLGISTGHGVVTVDVGALVKELGTNLGLPSSALDKIPAGTGVFTVMKSDQLAAAQQGIHAIRILSVWLIVLVLVLYSLAIYLARGIRRETLRNIGWAFVLVGLLVLVVRHVAGNYAIDALAQPNYRAAASHVWLIESSILGEVGRAIIFYGLVMVGGAVLAAPHSLSISARRWMAPTLSRRAGMSWGILGGAYLLLVLWGPTHALQTLWGILLLAALVAVGFEALRRLTVAEFPDAALHHHNASATMRALATRAVAHRPHRPAAAGGRASDPSPSSSVAETIAQLHSLHQAGALTDDEFDRAKQQTLDS